MYKVSVPLSMRTVREETLPIYLRQLQECKAQRVFIVGLENIYMEDSCFRVQHDMVQKAICYFKENGMEVGIWVSAFGHGGALAGCQLPEAGRYTSIEGIDGKISGHGYCPKDPKFAADYAAAIREIAMLRPDIIMLDDDFRMNLRPYRMGCFCPRHLEEFYQRVGEVVPREQIEEHIWTGGENKYRTAYLEMLGDTLLDFAKLMRKTVDEVDPAIRLGTCCVTEHWDMDGKADPFIVARAFAGKTEPFVRTSGAPYHSNDILPAVEFTRLQFAWNKKEGIEIFSEGDTYPRPRYRCSSKVLELFDLALIASGDNDGILAYVLDYLHRPDFEAGYVERYVRNEDLRKGVADFFAGKHPIGVQVVHERHQVKQWEFPERLMNQDTYRFLCDASKSPSDDFLSPNGIATTFDEGDYPVLVMGEDAKYVSREQLRRGAILDAGAAMLLEKAGIDVGLLSMKETCATGEYFPQYGDRETNVDNQTLRKLRCKEGVEVLSVFLPGETPAVYRYENAEGMRFLVLAFEKYHPAYQRSADFSVSYYRQAQLIENIEWLAGKKLPAVCEKNPNLYVLAASGDEEMAVLLLNVHLDDVFAPEIRLDKTYREIKFLNCKGELQGDRVILSDIPPYGVATFVVR